MKYRLRSFDVDALQLPCSLQILGTPTEAGSWLVAMDGKVVVFSNEEFAEKFQAVGETAKGPAAPIHQGRRPKISGEELRAVEEKPAPRGADDGREQRGPTLGERVIEALKAGPKTRATLTSVLDDVIPNSLSQALWALKKSGKVLWDEDRAVFRLPVVEVKHASA